MKPQVEPGIYRHYKGKLYEVEGLAFHTETKDPMVLYKPLYDCPDLSNEYGIRPWFVRPADMFSEHVLHDGENIQRFIFIEPPQKP